MTDNNKFTAEKAIKIVNNNLTDLGFTPRDSDGNDYQRGNDTSLRFKTGCAYQEVTVLVVVNGSHHPIRATSWAGVDRMILAIRGYIDNQPVNV